MMHGGGRWDGGMKNNVRPSQQIPAAVRGKKWCQKSET